MTTAYHLEERPDAHGDVESSLTAAERALYAEGDLHTARWWFDLAYSAAEQLGDGPAMARAALGLGGVWVHEHRTAAEAATVRARQRRALAAVAPDTPLAVRLRVRLCAEEDYRRGTHGTVLRALAEARSSGDAVATAEALSLAHHCLMDPRHRELRLELAQDLIGQAAWTGRRSDLLMGLLWRGVDLFLAGDAHAERSLRELRELLAVEDHLAVGFVVDAIEVMLAIRAGRLAHAETLAASCAERGHTAGDDDAVGWYGAQIAVIRWYQGRIGELVPALEKLVRTPALGSADYAYFAVLAVAAAAAGDRHLARGMLARLRGTGLADLPRGKSWLAAMHGVVEAARLLDDADTAAQAYDLLTPFADLPMIASLGVACFGSTHLALGTAALTAGRIDRAVEHFGQAVEANLALGHWPAVALSRWRLGHALMSRRGARDEAARGELALAEREADRLGMVLPAWTAPHTVGPGAGSSAGPAVGPATGPATVVCRRHGRQWRLELAGRSVLVDDSVGMRHLAVLIANPGREIRAADLAAGPALPAEESSRDESVSAQPLLDEQARHAYRERLAQLEAEIEEFESLNDIRRAEALRAERDWLITELAAATGLGGRTRRFTDGQERARIAVGKAVRRALTRIAASDPVIGEELRATVHTGLRCSYHPR
ncbi:hypothetical protein GCM10010156_14830 [Planobispora rosea]|uniref:Uncharacterized protein n=1 Tax=Planobispora rosea TaxID=35762 RepID=A0A8J3WD09_PLARO|nr:hypothetical protein [Planobispora rosea]GGS57158.1 hypothetical protein GCM10010156_14830 [Planobispora rosea]GIH83446.1 hypothetical protein Pro02_18540 [Planobispora rosea]